MHPRASNAWSLPNLLTYGRLVAVPVVAGLMFWPDEFWMRWAAWTVFSLAGVTDFFDGYLARIWSQQSSLGRMLDPIADKLLIAVVLLMLVATQAIRGWSIWAAIVILSREILVSGLREYLAELRVSVPVSRIAKWKTTLQIFAVGFLIVGPSGTPILTHTVEIGLALLWLSAALTLYTGWDYFRAGLRHVIED
jgi:CDP-diacylglycerol--glycerol-3-phosphate 3-phosphatidyltransferase/cardiolipin synthase